MSNRKIEHYVAPVDPDDDIEVDRVRLGDRRSNLWIDAWRDLRRRPLFYISSTIVLIVSAAALFPSLFTDVAPNNNCLLEQLKGGPIAGHPLGFTFQGCDVYSRVVYGASTSLSVGIFVVLITAVIGIPMGALAAYYGGWIDSVLSRVGDIFFAIPYFLAAVVVMSVLSAHRNVFVIAFAIGGFAWASLARILRAEVLQVKNHEYVMASEAVGRSRFSHARAARASQLADARHRVPDDRPRRGDHGRGHVVVPRNRASHLDDVLGQRHRRRRRPRSESLPWRCSGRLSR